MKETIGIVAVVLSIIGLVPYIMDVVKRKTQPHIYTWVIWSIATMVVFFGQWTSGGGAGSWTTGVTGILTIIIMFLSFMYGSRDRTVADTVFFCAALAAIPVWVVTNSPLYSVLILTAIDMCAFFPTIRKSFHNPSSETKMTYALNIVRHGLSIIALERYSMVTVLFPAMLVVMNTFLTCVLYFKKSHIKNDLPLNKYKQN